MIGRKHIPCVGGGFRKQAKCATESPRGPTTAKNQPLPSEPFNWVLGGSTHKKAAKLFLESSQKHFGAVACTRQPKVARII